MHDGQRKSGHKISDQNTETRSCAALITRKKVGRRLPAKHAVVAQQLLSRSGPIFSIQLAVLFFTGYSCRHNLSFTRLHYCHLFSIYSFIFN